MGPLRRSAGSHRGFQPDETDAVSGIDDGAPFRSCPAPAISKNSGERIPLDKVRTEMSLHVLAYNIKRVIAIIGVGPLMAAIRA